MTHIGKITACLAGGFALASGLCAQDMLVTKNTLSGNPYALAATRNLFGLVPPTPPAVVAQQTLPRITVTGMFSVFDRTRVLLKVSSGGDPDRLYNLGEGQGRDDVMVVRIDAQKGAVIFKNRGLHQEVPLPGATDTGGNLHPPR